MGTVVRQCTDALQLSVYMTIVRKQKHTFTSGQTWCKRGLIWPHSHDHCFFPPCYIPVSMSFVDFLYASKLPTQVIPLPRPFILFCSTRNRCGEIMELLWLLWGWTKQNVAGRSQHFSSILCPRAKQTEHHRRLYIVSIIFYDSNTFRSIYWVIQHWEDYVVPRCHRLSNSEPCSNQFRIL